MSGCDLEHIVASRAVGTSEIASAVTHPTWRGLISTESSCAEYAIEERMFTLNMLYHRRTFVNSLSMVAAVWSTKSNALLPVAREA